eukprot:scaffold68357_cov65-Phaeocystis_antarctica.AAC.1
MEVRRFPYVATATPRLQHTAHKLPGPESLRQRRLSPLRTLWGYASDDRRERPGCWYLYYGANARDNITLLRTLAGPDGTGYDRCLHVVVVRGR